MKFSAYIQATLCIAAAMFTACSDDTETVANRIYDTSAMEPSTVLIDGMAESSVQTFTVKMANPTDRDETVTYGVEPSLVERYNAIYGTAIMLPAENYELTQPTATIIAGAVESDDVVVTVKNLTSLDRNLVYVLPVTVVSSSVEVLESQRTHFIVVRGAALVNIVADITRNYCSLNNSADATQLNGITDITVQRIMNVNEFGKLISTVMGIEGRFLLRIGDAGVPDNQLQLATSNGNVTDPSWQFETGKWLRCAFTFSSSTGAATLWINGNKKATLTSGYSGSVNWASDDFYIGKSYDNERWLTGCIGEARVWNRILTDAELSDEDQAFLVPVDSEGLVAYWKFNEGAGSLIHDYANGYDLTCNTAPTWVSVSLPEK